MSIPMNIIVTTDKKMYPLKMTNVPPKVVLEHGETVLEVHESTTFSEALMKLLPSSESGNILTHLTGGDVPLVQMLTPTQENRRRVKFEMSFIDLRSRENTTPLKGAPSPSGQWLAELLGLTEGSHSEYNEWVTVSLEGQDVQVPLEPLGAYISYTALATAGLVEGVTLPNGDVVRLLTSSEWDAIYVKELHERRHYTEMDLGVRAHVFEGSATWVVDDADEGAVSDTRIIRGIDGVSYLSWFTASNTTSSIGWRVVLIPSESVTGLFTNVKYSLENAVKETSNTGYTISDFAEMQRDAVLLDLVSPENNRNLLIRDVTKHLCGAYYKPHSGNVMVAVSKSRNQVMVLIGDRVYVLDRPELMTTHVSEVGCDSRLLSWADSYLNLWLDQREGTSA